MKWLMLFLFSSTSVAMAYTVRSASQYFAMGTHYYEIMDYQGAVFAFEAGLERDPHSAAGYQGLGNCYYSLGRKADAMAAFRKSLKLNPDNPALSNFVKNFELQKPLGADAKATGLANPPTLTPSTPTPQATSNVAAIASQKEAHQYFSQATSQYRAKNFQGAVLSFEAGLRLEPDSAAGYQGLGDCYYFLERLLDALANYQKSLKLDPQNAKLVAFVRQLKNQHPHNKGMGTVENLKKTPGAQKTPALSLTPQESPGTK